MSFIYTSKGQIISVYDLRQEDLDIEVIAHALANLCRFGGHCQQFYSVAQHSIEVSLDVPARFAMAGLLHDATEAYMMDLPSPIKTAMPGYTILEQTVWIEIARKWKLDLAMPDEVKQADKRALVTEFHYLFARNRPPRGFLPEGVQRKHHFRPPLSPLEAEMAFLKRYQELADLHAARN